MNSRQRRVRAIELTLTPQQVVMVWLRNALQAGTLEEGARHSPPHRIAVANAVYDTVRSSMKGQPDPLVERAIRQAQREADLLYLLVVNANNAVFEGMAERGREYFFLARYLLAEIRGNPTKDSTQILRSAILMFVKPVIILDAAIAQVVTERLTGQPVLFHDSAAKLALQLEMATTLSKCFNKLAAEVGVDEINLEELRNSLQSETDCKVSVWISLTRVINLATFGDVEETHAAMDRLFLLVEPDSGDDKAAFDV